VIRDALPPGKVPKSTIRQQEGESCGTCACGGIQIVQAGGQIAQEPLFAHRRVASRRNQQLQTLRVDLTDRAKDVGLGESVSGGWQWP
jgi:hypothetical protein